MIRSFRKFFEFAGRQSRNWYLGLFYEIIRCILEALQFAALLVVLDGLVHDDITMQTTILSFGIMVVSVIGTIMRRNVSSIHRRASSTAPVGLRRRCKKCIT